MNEDQMKKAFERVFRQSLGDGRKDLRHLIRQAMRLGMNAERAGFSGGKTTINDADFLKLVFFAIIGAGYEQEYPLGAPVAEFEAAKQKQVGHISGTPAENPIIDLKPNPVRGKPIDAAWINKARTLTAPRDDGSDLSLIDGPEMYPETRDDPFGDGRDIVMSDDPRRPEQLFRCGSCSKDMEPASGAGTGWACVNQDCPDFHQAVEIEI